MAFHFKDYSLTVANIDDATWVAMFVPAKTPPAIVDALSSVDLHMPKLDAAALAKLAESRARLMAE